jgi:hypothetical protein
MHNSETKEEKKIAQKKTRFMNPIFPGEKRSNLLIFEIPAQIRQFTFHTNNAAYEYSLRVNMDIKGAPDAEFSLPLSIIRGDPSVYNTSVMMPVTVTGALKAAVDLIATLPGFEKKK